jgi:hypothetical protein
MHKQITADFKISIYFQIVSLTTSSQTTRYDVVKKQFKKTNEILFIVAPDSYSIRISYIKGHNFPVTKNVLLSGL